MPPERPDLSQVSPAIRAYIEALEAELESLREKITGLDPKTPPVPDLDPSEPPTPINVVTISRQGMVKRTPRHLYQRQRRGGMGIFDLETSEDDPPALLALVDETQSLLLVTDQARAFHLPLPELPESPVRSRGQSLKRYLNVNPNERPVLAVPNDGGTYLALVTESGQVRRFRSHYFGQSMAQGLTLYDINDFGPPAAACWTAGEDDLFIASRQGRAIRFAETQVPVRGCQGIRLEKDDAIAGVTAVQGESGVFLLSADGKGAIRLMTGFSANKVPGAGGKIALKTNHLVSVLTVAEEDDLFIISRLSKIIRFQAVEVSTTTGVVQGVNCMALRADETVGAAKSLSP